MFDKQLFVNNKIKALLRTALAVALLPLLHGCLPEDEAVTLPAPGDTEILKAVMGTTYDNRVYVDLETGTLTTMPVNAYELAFDARADSHQVYLNTGLYIKAWNTGSTDYAAITSASLPVDSLFGTDYPDAFRDSLVMNPTFEGRVPVNTDPEVYIIDRSDAWYNKPEDRYRKLVVLSADAGSFQIRYGTLDDAEGTLLTIPKGQGGRAYTFFNFGHGLLTDLAEPPAQNWDFVFTRYTFVYRDLPKSAAEHYYSVTGGWLNHLTGVVGYEVRKGTTENYLEFDTFSAADLPNYTLTAKRDAIGSLWKVFDLNFGYSIAPNVWYVLRTVEGNYYKLRFIDFFDTNGAKGTPSFEYVKL